MTIKNKKGISLAEVIIAIFIFSLMMTTFSMIFYHIFLSYKNAQAIQRNLEDAQYAVGLIAKSMRASKIVACDDSSELSDCIDSLSKSVVVYDYSQLSNRCIKYQFDDTEGSIMVKADASADSDEVLCDSSTLTGDANMQKITSGNVTGNFFIVPSVGGSSVGRATISMEVCASSDCSVSGTDKVRIQTSVSLRDYVNSGIN